MATLERHHGPLQDVAVFLPQGFQQLEAQLDLPVKAIMSISLDARLDV